MPYHTLDRESCFFAKTFRSSRPPERINPALIRRMAARLALEAWRIERAPQEAMREVWEEPEHSFSFSSFTPHVA